MSAQRTVRPRGGGRQAEGCVPARGGPRGGRCGVSGGKARGRDQELWRGARRTAASRSSASSRAARVVEALWLGTTREDAVQLATLRPARSGARKSLAKTVTASASSYQRNQCGSLTPRVEKRSGGEPD